MKTIGERLSYYVDSKGFTKKEFCEVADLVYNNYTRVLVDTRPLGMNVLDKIKKALPNLNVNWLLYGEGSPELIASNEVNEDAAVYSIKKGMDMDDDLIKAFKEFVRTVVKNEVDPRFSKVNEGMTTLLRQTMDKEKSKNNSKAG